MENLYDSLRNYCSGDDYPFHMPGHKRQFCISGGGSAEILSRKGREVRSGLPEEELLGRKLLRGELPYEIDITEIEGFDNLHHAEGILLEAQRRAAKLYGAEETFYLVGGSTCGILSAVGACAPTGTILMARNCHKAAYHAAFLNRLQIRYLYPAHRADGVSGPIRPDDVRAALEAEAQEKKTMTGHVEDGVRAVFLTSPTYDGVTSDVRRIAETAHAFGVPLIVDAAHGAHFGMHPDFPENAVSQGADLVIHSLHKTLPSLTQTALLHVNGPLVDRRRLKKMLNIYQSSSPSYILMASMDACVCMLLREGQAHFDLFAARLKRFRESLKDLKVLRLIETDDPSKVLISTGSSGMSGLDLSRILRERYHLEMELAAGDYVLALTSVGDVEAGLSRLSRALHEVDEAVFREDVDRQAQGKERTQEKEETQGKKKVREKERTQGKKKVRENGIPELPAGEQRCEICKTIFEAENSPMEKVALEQSAMRISGEYVYLYPPGIPLIVPGERIGEGLLGQLLDYRARGYSLQGLEDYRMETIACVIE